MIHEPSDLLSNTPEDGQGISNPYAASHAELGLPQLMHLTSNPKKPASPRTIRIIGIVFLIFGVIGLPMGVYQLLQASNGWILTSLNEESEWAPFYEAYKVSVYVYAVLGTLNLGLSLSMIAGSIGLVGGKSWSAQLVRSSAMAGIFYKVVELVGNGFYYWRLTRTSTFSQVSQQINDNWIVWLAICCQLAFVAIPCILFYAWVAYYLRRSPTGSNLAPPSLATATYHA